MSNILICSAGRRVSLVEIFRQEAKKLLGIDSRVFACDLEPQLSPACVAADEAFQAGRFNESCYIQDLLSNCLARGIKMVIPTLDTELKLLAENQKLFAENGIHLIISDLALIRKCRDKYRTHLLFEELGMPIPKAVDPRGSKFPFFVKPVSGSSSQDIHIIRSAEDLAPKLLDKQRFLHLEYLDKNVVDEYTLDLYFDRTSNLRCLVPRRRIATRAGEISKGVTEKNTAFDKIWHLFSYLPGARGCITLQIFRSKNRQDFYGIEINPRFGGGFPLSYHAGANYPAFLLREYFLEEKIERFDDWQDELLFLRHDTDTLVHGYKG